MPLSRLPLPMVMTMMVVMVVVVVVPISCLLHTEPPREDWPPCFIAPSGVLACVGFLQNLLKKKLPRPRQWSQDC